MYPTSVPTHSAEIGTFRSTTGSTLTTGAGGPPVARDVSPQPAPKVAITAINRLLARERATLRGKTSREIRRRCIVLTPSLRSVKRRLMVDEHITARSSASAVPFH